MPHFGSWAGAWWQPVLFAIIAGHITNVCVTIFLHRAQTHRSVRLHWLGGEELHNNHHADPKSATFSHRWFEVDIDRMYIQLLSALGLARVEYAREL